MSAVEVVLCAGLAIWFGLSVLKQFRYGPAAKLIKRLDRAYVLPDWRLFSPDPARSDYRLLYRDIGVDGTLTAWREISIRSRSALRPLWHPERRIRKGVRLSISALVRHTMAAGRFQTRLLLEIPYILLLHFVEGQPRDFRAIKRQFIIAETDGMGSGGQPRLIFLSAFHVLPEE